MNAESVLAGFELAVIKPEQIKGDLDSNQKTAIAGVMMRAFNIYFGAIKSADALTGYATDIIRQKKPNQNIAKRIYDYAQKMSIDIRNDVKECAEKRAYWSTTIAGKTIGIGDSMANLIRVLDQPEKWAFVRTNVAMGSSVGSYGTSWNSGQELGINWPVPTGIAIFLSEMKARGIECAKQCPPGFWDLYLRRVKDLKDQENWEALKSKIEWVNGLVGIACPKLWSLMKVEENKAEKYTELMKSALETGAHTKEYMDNYLNITSKYTSLQSKTSSKLYCTGLAALVENVLSGTPPLSFGFGKLYATVIEGLPGLMDFFNRYAANVRDPFSAAAKIYAN